MPAVATVIRSFDYLRSLQARESQILAAVQRVLWSGQLILGPEVAAFEQEFADWTGAAAAVGVASGTDALILALLASGIGPGDEVVTVANTAVPTASAIRAAGAIPRFVDVDPLTLQMDPEQIESVVSQRTRGVIPVHLYGAAAPMDRILEVAERHNLIVIEDCAHAHGTRIGSQHVGTFGRAGCFSFYPTKNLAAFGDAGICITRDPELAARLVSLRNYGFDQQRIALQDGRNSRLDELQAAILRVQLTFLDADLAERKTIADRYLANLAEFPQVLPVVPSGSNHTWHQFVIRIDDRPAMIRSLTDAGIGYGIHYEHPLHRMPAFARADHGRESQLPATLPVSHGSLPVTELAMSKVLSLPLYPGLTSAETDRVSDVVREALCRAHQAEVACE